MKSLPFITSLVLAVIAGAIAIAIGVTSHHAMAGLENQLRQMQTQLSAVSAQSGGVHRDLVTCADIQQLESYIDGLVAPQGYIGPVEFTSPNGAVVTALPLPAHCVNQ